MKKRNQIPFSEKLRHLMDKNGINDAAELSRALYQANLIKETDKRDEVETCNSAARTINLHLDAKSCESISGKWIKRYCDLFKCSADYLFDYLEHPTYEENTICEMTGFSEKVADLFASFGSVKKRMEDLWGIDIDNQDTFNEPIFTSPKEGQYIMESRDIRYFINIMGEMDILYDLLNKIREYITVNVSAEDGVLIYKDSNADKSFQKEYNSLEELQLIPSRKKVTEFPTNVMIDMSLLKQSKLREIQDILDKVDV